MRRSPARGQPPLVAVAMAALVCLLAVPTAGQQPTLRVGDTYTLTGVAGSQWVWKLAMDERDLTIDVTASQASMALLNVGDVPTVASHDAQAWGTSFSVSVDVCLAKGLTYDAFLLLQCWQGCEPGTVVTWTVTTRATSAANFPVPRLSHTLSDDTSTSATLTLTDLKQGAMRYAFFFVPAAAQLASRHLNVEVTSAQTSGLVVAAIPHPNTGPLSFYANCPSRRVSAETLPLAQGTPSGKIAIPPGSRGVWLGVTTWQPVETLQMRVTLASMSCGALATATLGFCGAYLPATVFTPTGAFPGSAASTHQARDQIAGAVARVMGQRTSPACATRVGERLCSFVFPACGGDNATVLPLCHDTCAAVVDACEDDLSAVGVLASNCEHEDVDPAGLTCYALSGSGSVRPGPWVMLVAIAQVVAAALVMHVLVAGGLEE